DRRKSRPAAMRAATDSVGLVSPRSTCESIGALTPLRRARSRSESAEASRSALTRAPITAWSTDSTFDADSAIAIQAYAITDTALFAWAYAGAITSPPNSPPQREEETR